MIFICKYQSRVNFMGFLKNHPLRSELKKYIRLYYYEFLKDIQYYEGEKIFFTTMDHMSKDERKKAQSLYEYIRKNTNTELRTEPRDCLDRFGLLKRMYELDYNKFNVFRAKDNLTSLRYPVFIRSNYYHKGPLSNLIYSEPDLKKQIRQISFPGTSYTCSDLLIVEYCDTDPLDGLKGRYSSFLIDDQIVPKAILLSNEWSVKAAVADFPLDTLVKYKSHEDKNPHEDWVLMTFGIAGLKYGRIDYGVSGGNPQVWEINQLPALYPRAIPESIGRIQDPEVRKFAQNSYYKFHPKYLDAIKSQSKSRSASKLKLHIPDHYRRSFYSSYILWRVKFAARKRISRLYQSITQTK